MKQKSMKDEDKWDKERGMKVDKWSIKGEDKWDRNRN